jgi:SAM-dependent methyltransferase
MQHSPAIDSSRSSFENRMTFRSFKKALCRFAERIVWGGGVREKALIGLLGGHYASKFRRQWRFTIDQPHFMDHRIGIFEFAFSKKEAVAQKYMRGFYSLQMLRDRDTLLDIGCGDGFFSRRFFAQKCSHIDAVDVEPTAIQAAKKANSSPNISYHLLNAVDEPFPRKSYSCVVWDGAIGHFPAKTIELMLAKIRDAIGDTGIFVGSESLGLEGHDHLQFFHNLDELGALFGRYFKFVKLKEESYTIGARSFVRREAYWRCSNDRSRIDADSWVEYQHSSS